MLSNILKQLSVRGVNIASSFICAVVIGREYGVAAFSEFVFAVSFINIFCTFALMGFEGAVTKEYFEKSFSLRKKSLGVFVVLMSSSALIAMIVFYGFVFPGSEIQGYIVCSALICVFSFYFANILKYEYSAYFYEFIRGGGINTFCLSGLLLFPVSNEMVSSGFLIMLAAICVFMLSVSPLVYKFEVNGLKSFGESSAKSFIRNGFSLSYPAIFSALIVSGDLVAAKFFLEAADYKAFSLMSRISFLMGVVFIVLNSFYSNQIVSLRLSWSLPRAMLLNASIAVFVSVTLYFYHYDYLALFINAPPVIMREAICALLVSHALNVVTAGLIPYLVCVGGRLVFLPTILGTAFILVSSWLYIYYGGRGDEYVSFSFVWYGTLLFFKLAVLLFSVLLYFRSRRYA